MWWSFNLFNNLFNRLYIPNKEENPNLKVINLIPGFNESKSLVKHISCDGKWRFDEKRYN